MNYIIISYAFFFFHTYFLIFFIFLKTPKNYKKNLFVATETLVTFLNDGDAESLILGERNKRENSLTNDEDVRHTGGERVSIGILDVSNIERTRVLLDVLENTNTTQIVTASDHGEVSRGELDVIDDLSGGQVDLDGVLLTNIGVGVTESATVVSGEEGDGLVSELSLANLAELELGFLRGDAVRDKAALDVIEETEMLVGLLDGDDIHETSGIVDICANFAVNLDETLHADEVDLIASQGVLEAIADQDDQRKALAHAVRARAGFGSPGTSKLGEHPMFGGIQSFQMFLNSSSHCVFLKMILGVYFFFFFFTKII